MQPTDGGEHLHFDLQPNNECKSHINTECPSPVHIYEKVKPFR